jgi:hypothetical protein
MGHFGTFSDISNLHEDPHGADDPRPLSSRGALRAGAFGRATRSDKRRCVMTVGGIPG